MSLNGEPITLEGGGYRAVLAPSGATLVSLEYAGTPLVLSFDPSTTVGRGYQGRTLVPWPNRITGGRYDFDGTSYEVPVNEAATGAALHGLATWQHWNAERISAGEVSFSLDLPASPGYPFDVTAGVRYALSDDGLAITVSGRNDGRSRAPFGASTHPYVTCGGAPLDECTVRLPAQRVLLTDARMAPAGLVDVAGTGLDFRAETPLAGRAVDHAFTGLPAAWECTLTRPSRPGVVVRSDAPWVQLYSADSLGRGCLAVEPMSCPPDAFNGPSDAVALDPGCSRTVSLVIATLA